MTTNPIELFLAIICATAYLVVGMEWTNRLVLIEKALSKDNEEKEMTENEYFFFVAFWPIFIIIGLVLSLLVSIKK